jgi:hypothetical protein
MHTEVMFQYLRSQGLSPAQFKKKLQLYSTRDLEFKVVEEEPIDCFHIDCDWNGVVLTIGYDPIRFVGDLSFVHMLKQELSVHLECKIESWGPRIYSV